MILEQREDTRIRLGEKDQQITELSEQLAKLQGETDKEKAGQKIKEINKHVNQPTSKKPEWDKDGNPKPAIKNQKNKKKKRKKRTGCGNPEKSGLTPDETHFNPLASCPCCGNSLGGRKGNTNNGRIVEDIPPPAEKTTVFKEVTESKWCDQCKKMVTSTSEKALPGSDIGLNAMIEMAYLWVMCALSFPKIRDLFINFKTLRLSTAGISRIMIRLSGIRAFIDAFPQYRSIMKFYLKLRQIIRDGEKLQAARDGLSELVFRRRLKALEQRLDALLEWNNPNDTLKDVIKKVRRQKEHILTFIKHDGAPHHNNYGEYIIKKGVVKRKMSGGSMSIEGARAYACIQSIAMTCQLRGISFHRFLKASLVCYIRTGRPMLLAEYEASLKSVAIAA